MPYDNFPKDIPTEKIDSCVKDVMDKGHDKQSAIAICYDSMVKGKELQRVIDDATREIIGGYVAKGKEMSIPPDGVTMDEMLWIAKAILDAPDVTDKASVSQGGRRGGTPTINPSGSQGSNDAKQERCFIHMKKLLGDEAQARKMCKDAASMGMANFGMVGKATGSRGDYPWDQCVRDQTKRYGSKDTAEKVCGAIRAKYGSKEVKTKAQGMMILMPDGMDMKSMLQMVEDEMGMTANDVELSPEELKRINEMMQSGNEVEGAPTAKQAHAYHSAKMERCLMHLKDQGADAGKAHRVCYAALGGESNKEGKEVTTIKQADGHYRWILFSSSSYLDRDNEIVSQKALEADTERMNTTKEFGTLDWWHTPIVLGDCDFSAMHGRISIESGTFRNDWVGERFATMKGLGASRTFYNPVNEPDAQGVYHNIRTFSRAILPAERASNRLTLVDVSAKEKQEVLQEKVKELITWLGGDKQAEQKVNELLKAAETVDKAAADAGITSKEQKPENTPETTPVSATEPKAVFVGDMTMGEFEGKLTQAVSNFLTPAVKEIGEQVRKLSDAQATTQKETGDKLATSIKSVQDMQTDLAARLAALEGLTPRAYRATQDPQTVVAKETAKERGPKGDQEADKTLADWLATTK